MKTKEPLSPTDSRYLAFLKFTLCDTLGVEWYSQILHKALELESLFNLPSDMQSDLRKAKIVLSSINGKL